MNDDDNDKHQTGRVKTDHQLKKETNEPPEGENNERRTGKEQDKPPTMSEQGERPIGREPSIKEEQSERLTSREQSAERPISREHAFYRSERPIREEQKKHPVRREQSERLASRERSKRLPERDQKQRFATREENERPSKTQQDEHQNEKERSERGANEIVRASHAGDDSCLRGGPRAFTAAYAITSDPNAPLMEQLTGNLAGVQNAERSAPGAFIGVRSSGKSNAAYARSTHGITATTSRQDDAIAMAMGDQCMTQAGPSGSTSFSKGHKMAISRSSIGPGGPFQGSAVATAVSTGGAGGYGVARASGENAMAMSWSNAPRSVEPRRKQRVRAFTGCFGGGATDD